MNNEELAPQHPERSGYYKIGITQGDTNGIGLETILKAFADSSIREVCQPILYAHPKAVAHHSKQLGLDVRFHIIQSAEEAEPDKFNLVSLGEEDIKVDFGQKSQEAGLAAFTALERVVTDLKMGELDAVVTAPINKATIQSEKFRFAGHTEFFHNRFHGEEDEALMILSNELMRVALVTTHLPLADVPYAVTAERLEQKTRQLYQSLTRDYLLSAPRIAVLSLNPHAGDDGLIGQEETDIITPAVKAMAVAGMPVYGPFAADGFFGSGNYRHFDAVLAMYHDQGLIPLKALSTEGGVNFTAGLPIVRTSPDHGTAYDIAGKGIASPLSMLHAIYEAIDIVRHRRAYDEACESPLPKLYIDRKEGFRG